MLLLKRDIKLDFLVFEHYGNSGMVLFIIYNYKYPSLYNLYSLRLKARL